MARRAALVLAVLAAALIAGRAVAAGPPQRVMSINLCADQLVLALAPPARIASVSWLARDPAESPMAAAARRTAVNHGLAEEVVRDRPDLVVTGVGTTPATQALLRRLHYRLLVLQPQSGFADIARDIRRVAAALGEPAKGEAQVAAMQAQLARLRADPAPPLRVAAWDGAGFSAAPGTLYDAILRAAGARNVVGQAGRYGGGAPDVEALLATAPQLLVQGAPGDEPPGRRTDTARHPLVRRYWSDRTVVVPQSAYLCGTPYSADAAVALRDQMRARLAQARSPLLPAMAP